MSPSPSRRRMRPSGAPLAAPFSARLARLVLVAWLATLAGCAAIGPGGPAPEREAPEERSRATAAAEERAPREETAAESSALPGQEAAPRVRVLVVKASAYNSTYTQTDSTPSIGAWGDRLRPGMKVIAVSKDLFEMGLRRGQRVRIAGLEGEYIVLDRMPSRWRQKIDIYMGRDVRAARAWGIRDVEISWAPETGDELAESGPTEASPPDAALEAEVRGE